MGSGVKVVFLVTIAVLVSACTTDTHDSAAANTASGRLVADNEPQNWLAHGRNYSEQRYSPLREVNTENVSELGLA